MSSIIIIKVCLSDLIYTDNQYRQALAAYVYAIKLIGDYNCRVYLSLISDILLLIILAYRHPPTEQPATLPSSM